MNMKETICKNLPGGPAVLDSIKARKKEGMNFRSERNRTTEIINRLHPDTVQLVVSDIMEVTKEAKTFRFTPKNGYLPPFQAGQYLNVFVEIEGVRTSRPISISSSPKQRAYYDITIARIAKGFVSDFFLDKVKVGDEFEASAPAGNFYHNPIFHGNEVVFIAGGSGVTPFASMIREVLSAGIHRQMHLLYGVKTEDAAFFKDEFETLAQKHKNFSFTLVVSEPSKEYTGRTGFISAECIKEVVGDITGKMFYICGPQVMYGFCGSELEKLKVPARRIRHEMFCGRQDIQNEPGWPKGVSPEQVFDVKIVGGPTIKARAGENLLIALERNKIRMNVCCRSGECSLCRIQLVSGKVFSPKGVLLRHADEKYGYIHSCKAFPISTMEIML
jgi:ferredoxin-NADP reductase/ferredoxin